MQTLVLAIFSALVGLAAAFGPISASACSRVLFADDGIVLTGRSMDWVEDLHTDLWAFPAGMKRDGGVGEGSVEWTSRYGSIVASGYNIGSTDGMNEKGLVVNLLYLAESDYGKANGRKRLSIGGWPQYVLDNFATVAEAVKDLGDDHLFLVAPDLPDGSKSGLHLAISDATGDSAIFEYLDGKLVVHHGSEYTVMTNSPVYDQQLALNSYWDQIGGLTFLPGTNRAADRFVRASYYLKITPKTKDLREAVAKVFSIVRNVSVPLGISTPDEPNISSTIWRSVSDQTDKRYYFESTISPYIFWVDLDKLALEKGQPAKKLNLQGHPMLGGEMSRGFKPAEPFAFLH